MSQTDTIQLMDNVQAHFIKAVKERDWSLFLFFRILSNDELQRLKDEKLAQEARLSHVDIEEAVKISRAVLASDDVSTDYFARLDSDLFRSMPDESRSKSAPFLDFLEKLLGTHGPGTSNASYLAGKADKSIIDFRYFTEDPHGRKCPIGAHIRHQSPRHRGPRRSQAPPAAAPIHVLWRSAVGAKRLARGWTRARTSIHGGEFPN